MPTADIFKRIAKNDMGNLDAADPRDWVPFYKLDGLHTNMRDKGAHASELQGSYLFAWTSGEGQGAGNVLPAAQMDDPYVRERQHILLYDIGHLVPIALEASLSKLEYSLLEFRGLHGNMISFGHETNFFATSLQMNISFIRSGVADGRSVIKSLGSVTGYDHVDPHDCLCGCYTVLLCSLPPGSDISSSCFSKGRAYTHSAEKLEGIRTEYSNVYVAALVFKGRHLRGGLVPRTFWQQATSAEGTKEVSVHVGFVVYPNGPAVDHTGTMSVRPRNGFTMSAHLEEHRVHQRNIFQAGLSIFGTRRNMIPWLAREHTVSSYNMYETRRPHKSYIVRSP
ncbi:hypothetical protein EXIGLDRAFT_777388 [Exidia glandulosa HHB12029]|uniref:Uncharacterized protein n=1 Tax=Exidia glandulosa HHB12029 TaxID=1314781 RepID=A0A165D1J4_EXIGL|nr:hypothetical protein EXIGLDRAFT_777388 [Exidia glandulosa HHB12029]